MNHDLEINPLTLKSDYYDMTTVNRADTWVLRTKYNMFGRITLSPHYNMYCSKKVE